MDQQYAVLPSSLVLPVPHVDQKYAVLPSSLVLTGVLKVGMPHLLCPDLFKYTLGYSMGIHLLYINCISTLNYITNKSLLLTTMTNHLKKSVSITAVTMVAKVFLVLLGKKKNSMCPDEVEHFYDAMLMHIHKDIHTLK